MTFGAGKHDTVSTLIALESAIQTYIDHKERAGAESAPRLHAAKRLKILASHERDRLQRDWDAAAFYPPFVERSVPASDDLDACGGSDSMELRTPMPSTALWKRNSSAVGRNRGSSQIVHVDRQLARFWTKLLAKQRAEAIVELAWVELEADAYVRHKNDAGGRIGATKDLIAVAHAEMLRLMH